MYKFLTISGLHDKHILTDLSMDPSEQDGNGNGAPEALPPPPPVPPNVTPIKADQEVKKFRAPMARRGLGTRGNKVPILTNHFKVNVSNVDGHFFHYSVCPQRSFLFFIHFLFADKKYIIVQADLLIPGLITL